MSFVISYRHRITLLSFGCLMLLAGCGPRRPTTAPVQGKITVGGKIVPSGKITFHPAEGRNAIGTIAADGTYTLTTFDRDDGALLGKHKVTIEATKITGPTAPKSLAEEQHGGTPTSTVPQVEYLVPKIYSRPETSTLEADVQPGANNIDFNLK
jgi:hypothetical protein